MVVLIITRNTKIKACDIKHCLAWSDTTRKECEGDPLTQFGVRTSGFESLQGELLGWDGVIKIHQQGGGYIVCNNCMMTIEWCTKPSCKNRFVVYEGNITSCRGLGGAGGWRLVWLITSRAVSPPAFCASKDMSAWVRLSRDFCDHWGKRTLKKQSAQFCSGPQDHRAVQANWIGDKFLGELHLTQGLLICETTVTAFIVSCCWTHSSWRQERSNTRWNLPRTKIES